MEKIRGLYTYNYQNGDYQSRIHLRVNEDSSGILFVDVTDAIHLSALAATIFKSFLDKQDADTIFQKHKKPFQANYNSELREIIIIIDSLLRTIFSEGHLCLDYLDETAFAKIEFIPLFSTSPTAPYKVDLALTYGCNDQCPHCYNEPSRFGMPSLELNKWKQVLDILAEQGVPHLILTGGEPTLHPDLLAIIRYADEKGFIVGMNTNGRRLAHAPFAKALKEAGLNHIQVTVGSYAHQVHNAMTGIDSHHQTIAGLKNAIAANLHTITNTTLMRNTMDDVGLFINYLYDMGIRTFAMNSMIAAGGGVDNENTLTLQKLTTTLIQVREIAKQKDMKFLWYTVSKHCEFSPLMFDLGMKRCNAAEFSVCVEPNGNVLPCQSFYESGGNVLFDSWDEIWQSDLFKSIRERQNPATGLLSDECLTCPILDNCGGGCMIERFAEINDLGAPRMAGCFGCSGSTATIDADYGYEPSGYKPTLDLSSTLIRATSEMNLPKDLK